MPRRAAGTHAVGALLAWRPGRRPAPDKYWREPMLSAGGTPARSGPQAAGAFAARVGASASAATSSSRWPRRATSSRGGRERPRRAGGRRRLRTSLALPRYQRTRSRTRRRRSARSRTRRWRRTPAPAAVPQHDGGRGRRRLAARGPTARARPGGRGQPRTRPAHARPDGAAPQPLAPGAFRGARRASRPPSGFTTAKELSRARGAAVRVRAASASDDSSRSRATEAVLFDECGFRADADEYYRVELVPRRGVKKARGHSHFFGVPLCGCC